MTTKPGDDARASVDAAMAQDIQRRALAFLESLPDGTAASVLVTMAVPGDTKSATLVMLGPRDRSTILRQGGADLVMEWVEGAGQLLGRLYVMAPMAGLSAERVGRLFEGALRAGAKGYAEAMEKSLKRGGHADA